MFKRTSIKINMTVRTFWIWPLIDYVKYLIGFLGILLEILIWSFHALKEIFSKEILGVFFFLKKPLYAFLRQSLNVLLCISVHVFFPVMLQYMLDLCKISRNFQIFKNVINEFCIFLIFRSIFHYLCTQLVEHGWFSFLLTHLPFPNFHKNM